MPPFMVSESAGLQVVYVETSHIHPDKKFVAVLKERMSVEIGLSGSQMVAESFERIVFTIPSEKAGVIRSYPYIAIVGLCEYGDYPGGQS